MQRNRALQLGRLFNGISSVGITGNTHFINAVIVFGQRKVSVGGSVFFTKQSRDNFACEALDGAPRSIARNSERSFTLAMVFPVLCFRAFTQNGSCQNAVYLFDTAVCGNVYRNNFAFSLRFFNHGFFSHRLFNHGFFNHGLFNHGFFNHGLFNHGLFNLGFFNLDLVDRSFVDRLGFRDCFGCGFQRGFLGKCCKAQRLCHKHHCQKSSQKSG